MADSSGHTFGAQRNPELFIDSTGSAGAAAGSEAKLDPTETDYTFDGAPWPLKIVVRENGTTTELAVCGEWDLAQQLSARKAIGAALDRRPECVVLDLSQLSFIDSSGIHNMIELHHRCMQQHIRLVIIPGPRGVQRPFEICGLNDQLPFLKAAA